MQANTFIINGARRKQLILSKEQQDKYSKKNELVLLNSIQQPARKEIDLSGAFIRMCHHEKRIEE
jgi:hypothetical protein